MELYLECGGVWEDLFGGLMLSECDMTAFLNYAAIFLANIGNYHVTMYLQKHLSVLTVN